MNDQKISSHFLKLAGKAELPKEIAIGHNYKLNLQGSITATILSDNHDGTFNKMYKFEPITLEIITDTGESLKLKDTRSMSQLLRARLWKQWKDKEATLTFDEYYTRVMAQLIQRADEIAEMYS